MVGAIPRNMCRVTLACLGLAGLLAGCAGNTSGGGDDGSGGVFVATPESVGTIEMQVCSDLEVSGTCGLSVGVKNAAGQPVTDMPVVCDTEQGLALIEPTTGRELTDSIGAVS